MDGQNVTHSESRRREIDFFSRAPWSTEFGQFSPRFGTANVQGAISEFLVHHIKNELPDIISRVNDRLADVLKELDSMPDRPQHPCHTVMSEFISLRDAVKACINNHHEFDTDTGFRKQLKAIMRDYQDVLARARPQVNMSMSKMTDLSDTKANARQLHRTTQSL